jgi:hypothetical protein
MERSQAVANSIRPEPFGREFRTERLIAEVTRVETRTLEPLNPEPLNLKN